MLVLPMYVIGAPAGQRYGLYAESVWSLIDDVSILGALPKRESMASERPHSSVPWSEVKQ